MALTYIVSNILLSLKYTSHERLVLSNDDQLRLRIAYGPNAICFEFVTIDVYYP